MLFASLIHFEYSEKRALSFGQHQNGTRTSDEFFAPKQGMAYSGSALEMKKMWADQNIINVRAI